ncbi:MAG: glucosyltransferase domain-containing protein [Clostridia bacterium]|nr:glucosyltransferase domain-containing protein [Clostridia bacterium]
MASKLKGFVLQHKDACIFLSILLFTLIPLFCMEYATDTYVVASGGVKSYAAFVFDSGRPLTALLFFTVGSVWDNVTFLYYISLALAICCAFLSVMLLSAELEPVVGKWALPLSALTVLNPLCLEYFLFIEKGTFFLSILFIVIGLRFFNRLSKKRWYFLPLCSLFIGLCACIYQSAAALFVPLVILFICLRRDTPAQTFSSTLFAVLAYGLGLAINVIFIFTFASTDRVGGINFGNLAHAFFFAGVWQSLLIYASVLLVLFGISCFFAHRVGFSCFSKDTLIIWLKAIFILFAAVCAVFAPFIMVSEGEVWFPFRIIYPLGATIGCICVLIKSKLRLGGKRIGAAILCCFFTLQIIFFEAMFITRLINNRFDHALAERIGEEISEYEEGTGKEIKNIAIYYDKSTVTKNPYVIKLGDSNVRAFSKSWGDVNCLNTVLDKDYKRVKGSDKYMSHFKGYDWQEFDESQLIFDGDTLHLCIY